MKPFLKYSVIFSAAVITAFIAAAAARATYQTIADIPEAEVKPYFQVTIDARGFRHNEAYELVFEKETRHDLSVNEQGEIQANLPVSTQYIKDGRLDIGLTNMGGNQSGIPLDISLNLKNRALNWKGDIYADAEAMTISYPKSEKGHVTEKNVKGDWSGRFNYTHPVRQDFYAQDQYCLQGGAENNKQICVSFSVHNPAKLTNVLLPGSSFFSPGPTPPTFAFGSDDPLSPFSEWNKPSTADCLPYLTQLSVCDDTHMQGMFEAGSTMVYDMMIMTRQLSTMMMQQAGVIGMLIDAKTQLETQLVLWKRQEQAYNDYAPSEQMCTLTTMTQELAVAEEKARLNTYALGRVLSYLDANPEFSFAAPGSARNFQVRYDHYRNNYCNPANLSMGMETICEGLSESNKAYLERDVNYTETVQTPKTLDFDLLDSENASDDEENVIALGRNLFGAVNMNWNLPSDNNPQTLDEAINDPTFVNQYQDYRSIAAMRSAARQSYSTIVGMKGSGTGEVAPHINALLKQFGMNDTDINEFLGENPSYFAQMEVLTKNIYQHPDFYTNLMTRPANIKRFKTTLEAIRIMGQRDRYESLLRKEMLLSLLVEMKLRGESMEGSVRAALLKARAAR